MNEPETKTNEQPDNAGVQSSDLLAPADGGDDYCPWTKEEIKIRINTMLWELIPQTMTMGRADEVAVDIFQTLSEAWEAAGHPLR